MCRIELFGDAIIKRPPAVQRLPLIAVIPAC
jgi:hypothetical protein